MYMLLLLLAGAALVAPAPTEIGDAEAFAQLDQILKDYDPRVKPGGSLTPLNVSMNGYILGISNVDKENRDITISMYLRHFWRDERLKVAKRLTLNTVKGLWHPDTFVVNEKKINLKENPAETFVRILPEGDILWSKLITKKLSCPKDTIGAVCTMEMESYGYSSDEISYHLKDGDESFGSGSAVQVPGISIVEVQPSIKVIELTSGSYSRILLNIKLETSGVWN